jgi:hypothetical protein
MTGLWHDITHIERQAWQAIHHHPATMTAATPAPEAPMSLIATLKQDAKNLAAKFDQVDEEAAAKLEQLEGNPVVDALLAVTHVPAGALTMVVDVLKGLGEIYPRPETAAADVAAPADAQPADAPAA